MAGTDPTALVRRYVEEVWNRGNLDRADELVAAAFVADHPAAPAPLRGPAGLRQIVHLFRTAYPDLRLTLLDLDGTRPDRVGVRLTVHGTHTGTLPGASPTGRRLDKTGPASYYLADGKLVADTAAEDMLGMLLARGVVLETH